MDIDAHQHFWKYEPAQFGWIDESMAAIRRDFLPGDLRAAIAPTSIQRTIAVQACQTIAETAWLLDLADSNDDLIAGVVGWVPLISQKVEGDLERLAARPMLRGIRHVLQAEPDDRYMLRRDFQRGLMLLRRFGLTYDILIYERHLPVAIELVDRHPEQPFVVDHIAKPRIKDRGLDPWRTHIRELARRENVVCKLSGVVTEADSACWTEDGIRPYLETVLEAFGPSRLMFGSDWPVCLVACAYARWGAIVESLVGSDRDQIFGGTARAFYGIPE